ncbi:hypothetical protein ACLE20_12895 [Rhizobium sp. YIM 134829]|uniref:hypothetical protein n=1 Tax=Rhizobium sp. YIM 134829 TaxID=3390453 RepID=UPI00397C9867
MTLDRTVPAKAPSNGLRLPAMLAGAGLVMLCLLAGLIGWLSLGGEMLLALDAAGLSLCF